MKYELRENQGIPAPLLALMAAATGLSVANCYYNAVNDFSASMVATLTQIGYVIGLVFVIPLGDLVSRKKLILTNYIVSACALLAIALAPNIYWVRGASLLAGASSVMPQFFIPLVSYHSAPAHKVRNVGIIQSCLLIGILGSRVFSGFLADVWGWRSVYFVACVFMLGCFLMIYKMLPVLSARSQESYAGLMKSLLRLLSQYPYLRRNLSLQVATLSGHSVCADWQVHPRSYSSAAISKSTVQGSFLLPEDVWYWLHGCWHF